MRSGGRKLAALILAVAGLGATALLILRGRPPADAQPTPSLEARFNDLELRSGDLIFRRGCSLVSRAVLAADGLSEFSHVGLLWIEGGQARVIHASPPEAEGAKGWVYSEPLFTFLSTRRARAAALYRLADGDIEIGRRAAAAARRYVRDRVPFDEKFDYADSSAFYCTELVWAAYREAGVDLVGEAFFDVRTPFQNGRYILPSALIYSPQLQKLRDTEVTGTRSGPRSP